MPPWQDVAFASGGLFFALALLPTLRARTVLPALTSVPTAGFLWLFAFTHWTLGLYWACGCEVASATAWTWLAVRSVRRSSRP